MHYTKSRQIRSMIEHKLRRNPPKDVLFHERQQPPLSHRAQRWALEIAMTCVLTLAALAYLAGTMVHSDQAEGHVEPVPQQQNSNNDSPRD